MDFPPKVVASITSMEEAIEAIGLGADIVEVRVDLSTEKPLPMIEGIYEDLKCGIIATIRPVYEGGNFKGPDADRIKIFKELAPFVDFIDVELRASNIDDILETLEGTDALPIVSYHDFEKTPSNDEMLDIIDRSSQKGGYAKLAVMPKSFHDVLRLYEVTLVSKRPVCTIAMGEIGQHSRIMSCVYGSSLTYGYVRRPVAPGQMRVDRIKEGLKILGLR
ncbi:type I 3-dehydroquinate dehydratase [Methanocella sp. CWC-04]|uniref:3-dehydroquinate dehydratase n=2 Tax=Methanooceanicella nereidis TaxID=2052831 RepID=A0AAP2W4K6_9EURY|nr:type I 3-dehydroquinate dehydratase [Methanocella sp. CWC-04]